MSRLSKLFNTKMDTDILSVLTLLCTAVVTTNSLNKPVSCPTWSGSCEDIFRESPIKSASISLHKLLSESNKFFVCGNIKSQASNAYSKPEIKPGRPSKTSYNRISSTFIPYPDSYVSEDLQ